MCIVLHGASTTAADLVDTVTALERALPEPKAAGSYADGRHTRRYWNRCTPAALDFVALQLHRS